ncbi:MAG: hypothetical protein ACYC27_03770 [Armatimonadota bacterium]
MTDRITAIFDSESQAEQAVRELRSMGLSDDRLSVVARHGRDTATTGEGSVASREEAEDTGERTGKGLLAGAGVGAIFGLAASLIPGVGPFITAGWLANLLGATAGGIVSGAVVGGTAGAVAGALAKAGYSDDEARFYGEAVERGDIMVAVDTRDSALSEDRIRTVLRDHGGRFFRSEAEYRAA